MKMKKLVAFVLAFVVVFSMCSTAFAAGISAPEGETPSNDPVPFKGDVSGDYLLSNADIILMARLIVDGKELTQELLFLADMNDDSQLTNADLLLLARQLVGLSDDVDAELTEEMEKQMIEDFVMQRYGDQLTNPDNSTYASIIAYFGTYSGCETALIGKKGTPSVAVQVNVEVNELKFTFPNPLVSLYLYKDSQFKVIDEAFEAGWITAEDLQNIWALREGDFGFSGENNKELSEELETKMFRDFVKQNGYEDDFVDLIEKQKEYTDIRAYYGTYSGCEAVLIQSGSAVAAVVVNVDVNGYRFSFPDPSIAIYLYKDSQFLRIDEAFEAGWITAEDVADIWNLRGGFFAK